MDQQRSYDVFSQIPNKESKYELNFRNLNMTQLPIDLSSFVSLYKLDISNNPFVDVKLIYLLFYYSTNVLVFHCQRYQT